MVAVIALGAWLAPQEESSSLEASDGRGFFDSFAAVAAEREYTSPIKSPTGVAEPRDMYFPGTEKLGKD